MPMFVVAACRKNWRHLRKPEFELTAERANQLLGPSCSNLGTLLLVRRHQVRLGSESERIQASQNAQRFADIDIGFFIHALHIVGSSGISIHLFPSQTHGKVSSHRRPKQKKPRRKYVAALINVSQQVHMRGKIHMVDQNRPHVQPRRAQQNQPMGAAGRSQIEFHLRIGVQGPTIHGKQGVSAGPTGAVEQQNHGLCPSTIKSARDGER
mmetsp:Transcript_21814/g.60648  ORF Transcript_21814/g.60648 Transcript_21814/m.60648 type:complete len:210 (-) Transcript_21814:260-889(-)